MQVLIPKPDMVAFWTLLMMFYEIEKISAGTGQNPYVPLDMALDSVDDMYAGCKGSMERKVKKEYLATERNKDQKFSTAWMEAEQFYNKRFKGRNGKRPANGLGKEQIMAIYVYTLGKPNVYLEFNDAVRTQKSKYKTAFKFHTLHFYLTDAVQTLNSRESDAERCLTGYRRVNTSFTQTEVLNREIRFGSFTSSSMGQYPSADRFGEKSCFEIFTCTGADVSLFSKMGEVERELLIPPYEVFKVTELKRRSAEKSLPCEVVYKMKSSHRIVSNLNCALFSP